MSARAWQWRRSKGPRVELTITPTTWPDEPVGSVTRVVPRVELARERRVQTQLRRARRRHRPPFPFGWTFIGTTEQAWNFGSVWTAPLGTPLVLPPYARR